MNEKVRNLRPLDNMVVIEKDPEGEKVSPGGLVIPETSKEGPICSGKVIGVGPGKLLDDGTRAHMQLCPGDRVYFGKWNGADVELDGRKLKIVVESDVLARDAREGGR